METIEEKRQSLGDLVTGFSHILERIAEAGGELTPELEALFDQVGGDLQVKADSYAFVMDKLEAEAEFWKARADSFARVSKSCDRLRDRMKDAIKAAMVQLKRDEIEGVDFRFKLSTSSRPKLVLDEAILPAAWKMPVTELVPDKERIVTALDSGEAVPGARYEEVKSLRKYVNTKRGKK